MPRRKARGLDGAEVPRSKSQSTETERRKWKMSSKTRPVTEACAKIMQMGADGVNSESGGAISLVLIAG